MRRRGSLLLVYALYNYRTRAQRVRSPGQDEERVWRAGANERDENTGMKPGEERRCAVGETRESSVARPSCGNRCPEGASGYFQIDALSSTPVPGCDSLLFAPPVKKSYRYRTENRRSEFL